MTKIMYLFFLPILKSVINEIENSKDGKPEYQGQNWYSTQVKRIFEKSLCQYC